MRHQIIKLKKVHSTKGERRFLELLKKNRIPFRSKVQIAGEVDFLIGKYAIEIDGHQQDVSKNVRLIEMGYYPIHFRNNEIGPHLEEWLKKIWQEQIYSPRMERQCR